MNRIQLRATASSFTLAFLALIGSPTSAATPTSGCSAVVAHGKQICLSVSPQTITAHTIVRKGGRGWFGQIEIDDPTGLLIRTGDNSLPAPADWATSQAGTGRGRYCAIDWRRDVYGQTFLEENSTCITAS
ncbi:hypothetical protein [Kitasatospora mediocidica]|uniref:hypothetical protein n=1 Tax=Kitasatospora mediocidica TaxID=58352 RepID=UPI00055C3B11|nr:hypothetical protein [Kitasatospora mediocidica]